MARVHRRDQEALMLLYQQFGNMVYSMAVQVLRDPSLAEEVTQDIFLKVWRQAEKWDPAKGKLSSWLLTVTRYGAIDRLRQEQRQPRVSADLPEGDHGQTAFRASEVNDPLWHDGQLLRQLLQELPPEQAEAIRLAFYQGLTHSQLAEQLALPLGTIKTRLRLGLQKLRLLWQAASDESTDRP